MPSFRCRDMLNNQAAVTVLLNIMIVTMPLLGQLQLSCRCSKAAKSHFNAHVSEHPY
jgi:hypothetical protein